MATASEILPNFFIGTREVIILHGGDAYRLRLTGQNKLILTK